MKKPKNMIFFFATLIVLMFVTSAAPQSSESKIAPPVYSSGELEEIIPVIIVLKDQPQKSQTSELSEIGRGHAWANVTHFSTFSLAGAKTIAVHSSQADLLTINGGTGGSITTSEPDENIAKAQRYEMSLIANLPVTYEFTAPELGVYEIAVTGGYSENDISLMVEALNGRSKLVSVDAPGTLYKNLNIWAGTKKIKDAMVRFKVETSWLASKSLAGSDVKMVKWDGSKWVQIETREISMDASYRYYEAKTDSFSHFAITGLKEGITVPKETPEITSKVTETPEVSKEKNEKAKPLDLIAIIGMVVFIAIVAGIYLRRK